MAKRLLQGVVLFFALYAFAFMPLGQRTALEHVQAVIGSTEAQEAASELKGGATRLVRKLRGAAENPLGNSPTAVPSSAAPGRQAAPGHSAAPSPAAQPTADGVGHK